MKKKTKIIILTIAIVITSLLIVFPFIEIDTGEQLICCSYTGDFSKYDKNHSYNELYCYSEEHDISISNFDVNNFLFFYTITMDYIEGDFRESQFVLPETYITNFIENAEIKENTNKINIAELIENKTAIVGNTQYSGNDYTNGIFYYLDGKHEELYVFKHNNLIVIQVGSPDELPKYIAYK